MQNYFEVYRQQVTWGRLINRGGHRLAEIIDVLYVPAELQKKLLGWAAGITKFNLQYTLSP